MIDIFFAFSLLVSGKVRIFATCPFVGAWLLHQRTTTSIDNNRTNNTQTIVKMATTKPYPFKETPILFGEDAIRFQKEIENPVRASEAEKKRMAESYAYIKSLATFPMP